MVTSKGVSRKASPSKVTTLDFVKEALRKNYLLQKALPQLDVQYKYEYVQRSKVLRMMQPLVV